ncbi:MAG: hypothetical protein RBR21_11075 [Bacteroidales bacterium]|nr:hypothetical protein [Bacteroidales bacterium]
MKRLFSDLSIWIFALISLVIIIAKVNFPMNQPIAYDTYGYYLYLPTLFIYDEASMEDLSRYEALNEKYGNTPVLYQFAKNEEGKYYVKSYYGNALMYLPFFTAAHLYASGSEIYPADGFSKPYQNAVRYSGMVWAIIGIWMLRKILLRLFPPNTTAVILGLFFFATYLLFFFTLGEPVPHVYTFVVITFVLWFTMRWHEKASVFNSLGLGLSMGLTVMCRSSEALVALIPVLWGITDRKSLIEKLGFLKSNLIGAGVAITGFLFMIFIQLLYYKVATGSFFYFPYDNPQAGLNLLHPTFIETIFGFRKGWLVYSPFAALAIYGLIPLWKKHRPIFWGILAYFILNIYVISAFSTLYSYGWRAFVQAYAVFVIPFGCAVEEILTKRMWKKIIFSAIALFFMVYSAIQAYQVSYGIIDGSRMTGKYFRKTFLQIKPASEEQKKYLLIKRSETDKEVFDNEEDYTKRFLAHYDFESVEKGKEAFYDTTIVHSGKYSLKMTPENIYSKGLRMRYKDLTDNDHAWIRSSVWVYPTEDVNIDDAVLVCTFEHDGESYKYRVIHLNDPRLNVIPNQWNKVTLDYLTPEVRTKNDVLKVYMWYRGTKSLYVDDLKIECFDPKF